MSDAAAVVQPPYLALAQAARNQDVQDIAEMSAMRVATPLLLANGAMEGDPADIAPGVLAARCALALRVVRRQMPRDTLALALLQAPDVAMAVAAAPSGPAEGLTTVDLAAAWARNWTDFALITAAE